MSLSTGVEEVFPAVEEAAGLLNVPCSRDKLGPILTAFAPFEGGFIFSASVGERQAGDLDLTIQVPRRIEDPYAHAVANGLVPKTDHPVGALLADIDERCSVNEYLIDVGVVGGLNKIYVHFPRDLQKVSKLADVPSMPPATAENADFFARHGLEDVAMMAIDYRNESTNLYFPLPTGIEQKTILSLLREMGLPEPDEQLLESAANSFRVYFTLGWDSSKIERIAFARRLDRPLIRDREPELERFVTSTPYTYPGDRFSISIVKWSPGGEWFNAGSYYQFGPLQWEVLKKTLT